MKRKNHVVYGNVLTLAAALLLASAPGAAVGEIVITTAGSYTFAPAAGNLITGLEPTAVVNSGAGQESTGPVAVLTDGMIIANNANTYAIANGAVITYALSVAGHSHIVTGMNIYSGWNDIGRKNIVISGIYYSTPDAPDVFIEIPGTSVSYDSGTSMCLVQYTSTDGVIATDVHSIRINFGDQQNGRAGYREIEIIGMKTAVQPDTATDITLYTANLAGTVYSELDAGTVVALHWGTASDPATWTDSYTWPSTPPVGGLSRAVSGLSPSTEYFFSFSASNEAGVVWGTVASFATLPGESEAVVGEASEITATTAKVSGTLAYEGVSPTTVYAFWGTDAAALAASVGLGVATEGEPFTASLSGLTHEMDYYYAFMASNSFGMAWSETETFTTTSGTPVVMAGTASDIFSSSAELAGTLSYEGAPPTTVYAFWGEDAEDLDFSQSVGVVAEGADFATALSGLTANTVYFYSFLASNDVAEAWSVTNSFRTPGAPELTGMVVDRILDTTAHVSATLSDGGDSRIYFVYWKTSSPSILHTNDFGVVSLGGFHAVAYGLSASTSYGCQLVAVNADGTFVLPGATFTTAATIASFVSVQSGDWSDPATWGEPDAPRAGLDVTISTGHIVLVDMETEPVRDVQVYGTLSFDGWDSLLRARNVEVAGTVTHELNTATTTNSFGVWEPNARVNITCTNLSVVLNGKIDVNAKGYAGGSKASGIVTLAAGPGAGIGNGVGGGHGGNGGNGSIDNGGLACDTPEAPSQPGSGGAQSSDNGNHGAIGGGAVKIIASGSVTVSGSILANGANGRANHGGGGAGGAIHIVCETFIGTGVVSANGGEGPNATGGGGGGGCIAIHYDPVAQSAIELPTARIVALGGQANSNPVNPAHPVQYVGEVGTLWFPDNQFLTRVTADDIVRLGGRWVDQTFTEWTVPALTLENGWLRFMVPGFRLNVTGDLSVLGSGVSASGNRSNARIYRIELTDGTITCGGDMLLQRGAVVLYSDAPGTSIMCTGDFTIRDRSLMYVYSAPTNNVMPDFTSSVTAGGRIALEDDSWIYLRTDVSDPAATLFTSSDFFIDATSGIDAALQGYRGGANKDESGFGPGFGLKQTGASHGGRGGSNITGGGPYGSAENPVTFGSGGGAGDNNPNTTGSGGGVIRISATGKVVLNGTLLAYGGKGRANHGGGGSGGSVNIACDTFWGTNGVVSAYGDIGANNNTAGGSGGRIAVRYNPASQVGVPVPDVALSVRGAKGADPGTLWFPDDQLLVRATRIRHSGVPVVSGFTRWNATDLAFEDGWFRMPEDLVELNVSGTLSISGTGGDTLYGDQLEASNTVIRCGSLVLGQSGALVVKPGEANLDGAVYAGLVDVAGAMVVGPDAWVYPFAHPYNGGMVLFRANTLDIDAAGGFNAGGLGYAGGIRANNSPGNGPGAGTGYSNFGGGGGYGGQGATHTANASALGGGAYGHENLPLQPGSGGAGRSDAVGGYGGGLVWIWVEDAAVVNGTVSANGGKAQNANAGDGSGGGILIDCRAFSGSGTLAADGGINASSTTTGANGGGGRIAVWEKITNGARTSFMAGNFRSAIAIDPPEAFTGKATAECGSVGRADNLAGDGSVVFLTSPPEGTIFMVR